MTHHHSTDTRTAVVIGATRGIGRAVALQLAADGYTVAGIGRDATALRELQDTAAGHLSGWACDVSGADGFSSTFHSIRQALGTVDIVIHCAAALGPVGPFWTLDPAGITQTMQLNVTAAYLAARLTLSTMVEQGQGRLFLLSSGSAHRVSKFRTVYAGSKAPVDYLVRTVGAELAEQAPGVSVTSIYPGIVATEMQDVMRGLATSDDPRLQAELAGVTAKPSIPATDVATAMSELVTREPGELNGQIMALRAGDWEPQNP